MFKPSLIPVVSAAVLVLACVSGRGAETVPPAAKSAGYLKNTFSSHSDFSDKTVDQGLTYASGFKWYNSNILQPRQPPTSNTFNPGGTLTMFSVAYNLGLVSAANLPRPPGFVGIAFGGGGYFEAEIKFDPAAVSNSDGWPSFWAVSLESTANLPGQQWKGQPGGYNHTVEFDVFEYLFQRRDRYGATAHDFYGIYDQTCPARCVVHAKGGEHIVSAGTDWQQFHRVAMLWIPATASKPGAVRFYFDDLPVGDPIVWTRFTDQPPPPTVDTPWTFGEADRQHLVLILGSGISAPMTVRSVNVWQASAADNLVH